MMWSFLWRRHRGGGAAFAGEEATFLLLFTKLVRAPGVERFHAGDVFRRQPRETSDEVHERPTARFPFWSAVSPSRHSREPDPVFDDREQFAVAQLLCPGGSHVRRRRIQALPHRGSAPVVGVTDGAVIREV